MLPCMLTMAVCNKASCQMWLEAWQWVVDGAVEHARPFSDVWCATCVVMRWMDVLVKVRRWVEDAMATGVDEQVQRRLVEEATVAHGLLAAL